MIRKQSHDGSLATVRAICFRVHHGCIILRTIFCNAVSFAHLTTFLIRTQFDAFTIYSSIPTVPSMPRSELLTMMSRSFVCCHLRYVK